MWLRRMILGRARRTLCFTHALALCVRANAAQRVTGRCTRPAPPENAMRHARASNPTFAVISVRHDLPVLFAHAHVDVAGRADIGADVAADALAVVGVDIAAGRRLVLLDARTRRPAGRRSRSCRTRSTCRSSCSAWLRRPPAPRSGRCMRSLKLTEHFVGVDVLSRRACCAAYRGNGRGTACRRR